LQGREDNEVLYQYKKINYFDKYSSLNVDTYSSEYLSEDKNKYINENNIIIDDKFINNNYIIKKSIDIGNLSSSINYTVETGTNYLLVRPNWESAVNRITQITAIGDILYTVYHSYIYILSIILLLGMVGAIILTADSYQEIKVINISKNKKSSIFSFFNLLNKIY
jgi:hypothetical protein